MLGGMFIPCQAQFLVYYAQTMYNIKQAAARAGVTVPVLRAWERRYGIVAPDRTDSGYRQFDDRDVARIRTMRTLVEEGWSPSAAAAAIVAGTVDVRADADAVEGGRSVSVAPSAEDVASESAALTARFVEAARSLEPAAVGSVLDDVFAHGSFERATTDYLFPALAALGEAWAAGRLSVAGEHMASATVLRRLGQALEATGPGEPGARRILVGMPPGGRHELGALAFAIAARRAGLRVTYLGGDLPNESWLSAADGAAAAVIGAVVARDRTAVGTLAHQLHERYPDLVVAVGGPQAPADAAVLRLPPGLVESVMALEAVLGRRAADAA
jgi:DNA-binding transcriptional MerR regulator/methylmalonyl-CoA mutase cobalamin-binding subunit